MNVLKKLSTILFPNTEEPYQISDPTAVKFDAQELTESQQMQARKNLGLPYKVVEQKVILPETSVEFESVEDPVVNLFSLETFVAGETYNVSWDGEEYNCVAGNLFDGVAIGNSSMFGGDGGNNEPFCIATFGGETMILSLNTGTHVISIAGPVVTIHHLSEDYLKNVVPAIYLNSPCTSGDVEVAFNKRELTGGIVVWDSQVIDLLTSRQDKDGNTIVVTRSAADNATLLRMHLPDNDGLYTLDENWYYGAEAVLYLKSSTSGSGKIFEIRVDDSGELTAREVSK